MSPFVLKTLLVALGGALIAVGNSGAFPTYGSVIAGLGGFLAGVPVTSPGTAAKIEEAKL